MPAIHLIAGKEFETAEEAEEWLCYVVSLEGHESIDQPDEVSIRFLVRLFYSFMQWLKRTPLQAACFYGNRIGVNWLLARGASVNVSVYRVGCSHTNLAALV